jgi:F0F1-type ATP synthase epsilon subunit
MLHKLKSVAIELSTPRGIVFTGRASDVELRTTDGMITISPSKVSYLNLTHMTRITLRVGSEFLCFHVENAAASLRNGLLMVLAEKIRRTKHPTS